MLIDNEGADFPSVEPRMRTRFDDEVVALTSTAKKKSFMSETSTYYKHNNFCIDPLGDELPKTAWGKGASVKENIDGNNLKWTRNSK